jgi:pyridoxal phosphate enzyme (YggS family)
MLTPEAIAANAAAVEGRIAAACARSGRSRGDVTLVAVTKTFPAEAATYAIAAGITDIGENRVQEARDKQPLVYGSARWHLIGHLQSNKAKEAVRLFSVIQTVDSIELADKIGRAAEAAGKQQDVLLEVNIGRESQKSGFEPEAIGPAVKRIQSIPSLLVRGLMAIPPVGTREEVRRFFHELRVMRDALGMEHLSMGMSEDFEVAIEEGSTMIRVGRAIFGSRG